MKKFSCASRTTDMTQKTFPKPQPYHAGAAFLTLFEKEVLRFRKIALQTVLAPVIMGVMYLAVFGELLDDKMATFEGVTYTQFLVPGLVMMSLLQNSFANSASSLLQSKIMGSLVFIELPPFSGLQLAAAFIGASVVRGLVVGNGVFIATFFWGRPMILSPLWVLAFAVLGAVLMASLGVICGLWADKYDQLGAFQSFVLMPLTFLSGVFYSVKSLPPVWETASRFNPFFYMTDGFRYGFFGQSDFNAWVSLTVLAAAAVVATAIAARLFVIGYKLRK